MPIETLMKLPPAARRMWERVYSAAKEKYGEQKAAKIAWASVKQKFKKVEDKWVARAEDFEEFTTTRYVFSAVEDSIQRDSAGGYTRDFVLATTNNVHKRSLNKIALQRMAEQINTEKLRGRLSPHDVMTQLSKQGLSPEEIEKALSELDEGIEAVQAFVDNDKLKARVHFTPEAYMKAKDYKAVSIEARIPVESIKGEEVHQARLMGFILTNEPADADAVEVSSS